MILMRKLTLTKIMAVVGTIFVWLPIITPVLFSLSWLIEMGTFEIDYLMPSEAFSVFLAGSALLIWAAFRAMIRNKAITLGVLLATTALLGAAGIQVITGMSSGKAPLAGLPWVLVQILLGIYILTIIFVAINGILLIRDLYRIRTCRT